MTSRTILLAALALVMVSRTTPSAAQCLGDFNGDFKVTVDELLVAVQDSLNDCHLSSGPRFTDNRDGTVTDRKTGLVWEEKDNLDGSPNPSDPHDADNTFGWSTSGTAPDGTMFTTFLFALNGGTSADGLTTSGCFTGHCDWRLPTIEELDGIVDPSQGGCAGGSGPCVDPNVGPTQADGYWSASTFTHTPSTAWLVDFSGGGKAHGDKAIEFFVRAVRRAP
jgi:hypothetical protein